MDLLIAGLGMGNMGCWLSYRRGSFHLKEFYHSQCKAQDRANSLATQVGGVKLLDESESPHAHVRALLAGAIEVDTSSNRLIL